MKTNPPSDSLQLPILSQSQYRKFRLSAVFWTGLILLVLGNGPLEIVISLARSLVLRDPNPNTVAFGILPFLTFWLSVILMIVGVRASYLRYKSGAQIECLPPGVQPRPLIQHPQRPKFRLSAIFWTGLILLVLGTGPLVTFLLLARLGVIKDPNPNPIAPGILAFLTFWPSVILMIVGVTTACLRYKSGAQKGRLHQV